MPGLPERRGGGALGSQSLRWRQTVAPLSIVVAQEEWMGPVLVLFALAMTRDSLVILVQSRLG